ncbi:MAG: sensor domain-containing diguanylate cyclase [Pseudomonadota bacterium]
MAKDENGQEGIPGTARILDALPDPTIVLDVETHEVVYWNAATEAAYGRPDGQRQYCHSLTRESAVPCGDAGYSCPLEFIRVLGEPIAVEQSHPDGDGRTRNTRLHAAPLRDGDGRVRWVAETHMDVTDWRDAERWQVRERARKQQYMDVARVMLLVLDHRGRVAEINPYGAELLGMPRDRVEGLDWVATFVPPERREATRETFRDILSGDLEPVGDVEQEILVAGEERRVMAFRNAVLHDEEGEVAGILSSAEDITEQRRLEARERAHRHALEQLHAIAADADLGLAEKLRELLALGCETLGMEHGGLSLRGSGHCRLRYVHSPAGVLQPGQRVTPGSRGGVVLSGGEEERAFPSSLSVAVEVDGRSRGALHFVSADPRSTGGEYEREFLGLLAQWAGYELGRSEAYRALEHAATFDALTGSYGRLHFDHTLEAELGESRRLGHPLSLLMFDIDHFKAINDNLGHGVGDDVLRELVARLAGNLRVADVLARYGGEEFVAILPRTDHEGALGLAEKLRRQVADYAFPVAGEVTISVGVATTEGSEGQHALLRRLDDALYAAKSGGRDRVEVAAPPQ